MDDGYFSDNDEEISYEELRFYLFLGYYVYNLKKKMMV